MSAPTDTLTRSVHREFMMLVFVNAEAEFAFSCKIGLCMCVLFKSKAITSKNWWVEKLE